MEAAAEQDARRKVVRARTEQLRGEVVEVAAELFGRQGFPAVRMADIGARVGVTARALYRHFPNKQALLFAICRDAQDGYLQALRTPVDPDPTAALRQSAEAFLAVSLAHRDHAMLWQRDGRYLASAQQDELRARLRLMVDLLAKRVSAVDMTCADRPVAGHRLRARAILSTLMSSGHHPLALVRPETDNVLLAAVAAIAAPGAPAPERGAPPSPIRAVLDSRTDRLLQASTVLFARSGYPAVTLKDIAAEVDLLHPTMYHYVDSKSDILVRLIERWLDWQTLAVVRVLESGAEPTTLARAAMDAVTDLILQFPELYTVALTERLYLPERAAARLLRTEIGLLRTLTRLIHQARPELTENAARTLMYATVTVVGDLARSPQLRQAPHQYCLLPDIRTRMLFAAASST